MQVSNIIAIASLATAAKAASGKWPLHHLGVSTSSQPSVSYDPGYSIADRTLDVVACSNGANGLETIHGWDVQGDIPSFPYIGGVPAVTEWDSPSCGTCWKLAYKGRSITILAIDRAPGGYNIAVEAMNNLTNGQAEQLGRVEAEATQVAVSECGITD